jgi:hypothetical protein
LIIDPQHAPPPPPKRLSTKQMLWPARRQCAHRCVHPPGAHTGGQINSDVRACQLLVDSKNEPQQKKPSFVRAQSQRKASGAKQSHNAMPHGPFLAPRVGVCCSQGKTRRKKQQSKWFLHSY